MPLMIRGARQVGKSYAVKTFAAEHFNHLIEINFEIAPEYKAAFEKLDPAWIIEQITVISGQAITPGDTLLFLDEIQECPSAIQALRYFKEKLPILHVISAGSLLEFALSEAHFRMPVGRIEFMHMHPLSFIEFLEALGEIQMLQYYETLSLKVGVSTAVHQKSLELMRLYMALGGMPAVVNLYRQTKDLLQCRQMQVQIQNTYRNDFGKYANQANRIHCEKLFSKAPALIAQHFRYRDVDPDVQSRSLKVAVQLLTKAQITQPVYQVSSIALPLSAHLNEKKFKLLFVDIGLVQAAMKTDIGYIVRENTVLSTQGQVMEQLVGQALTAYSPNYDHVELFFWMRDKKSSQAEIDYLYQYNDKILPLEVKSGKSGRLKSLKIYLEETNMPLGLKISADNLYYENNILSIPVYLLHLMHHFIEEALKLGPANK
ncbi:MAG: hypothetical protein A3F17_06395 [Gammaproteobacteria bacterium RIFCSPHIGHO2_12_FULL_41_15]|nr:MAG: hypothetical protein A3F17_06395 [Gammaproteobacteria bacterium RIFCSPHIGHO2_12_FULL_41_15]